MQKLYLLLFSFFFFVIVKAQTTINITPVADNTIYQDFPDNSNGAGANFTAGTINVLSARRAFVKFNVAGAVPAGATIISVTLTMNLNKSGLNNSTVYLHKTNSNWGEGSSDAGDPDGQGAPATINDATWNCNFYNGAGGCTSSWANPGGDYTLTASASTPVTTSLGNYTWTSAQMVSDVQFWLINPSNNFGWEILANETVVKTAKRFSSRQGANPPGLSITYNNPIPVKLISFKALETKNGTLLNWETAQEFNNAFFVVEHSLDGINFSSIGKVNGHGTTALPNSYSFIHDGVDRGRHYYRLAQTDIDGRINYSFIVSVIIMSKSSFLEVSPNPVINTLLLKGSSGRPDNIYSIINQAGIIVLSGFLKNNQVNLQGLANGNYFIRVQQQDGTLLTGRFLKQ